MADMRFPGNPTFQPPKEFTGKADQFEEFSYKMRAYMNLLNPDYSPGFIRVEDDPTNVIRYDDILDVQ